MNRDTLVALVGIVLVSLIVVVGLGVASQLCHYMIYDYTVRITDESSQSILYEGRAACVRVSSMGSATYVEIAMPGYLCMFPGQSYMGQYSVETINNED